MATTVDVLAVLKRERDQLAAQIVSAAFASNPIRRSVEFKAALDAAILDLEYKARISSENLAIKENGALS